MLRLKSAFVAAVSGLFFLLVAPPALAETIAQALASAYADNPEINARAGADPFGRRKRADCAFPAIA